MRIACSVILREALRRRTAIVAAALLIAGCSGKTPTAPTPTTASTTVAPAANVSSVSVSGNTPALGSTSQFVATAMLSDGTMQNVTSQARWSSSTPSVATVTNGGIVTSVASGQSDITATYQNVSGNVRLLVTRADFSPQITYDDQVPMIDRQIVVDGIAQAQSYFMAHFGRGVQGLITIRVMAIPGCAAGGAGEVFGVNRMDICTLNPSWGATIHDLKTMAHEMFHLMQNQHAWPIGYWSKEGSAEYVAYAVTVAFGHATFQEILDCQITGFIREGRPMELLAQIGPTTPSGYKASWLAWHLLLGGLNGVDRITSYLDRATFEQAFGISQAELDARFTLYRQSLQLTVPNACDRQYRRR